MYLLDLIPEKVIQKLTPVSLTGATYALLTLILIPVSYGTFQLWLSLVLIGLPNLFPSATYGLFIEVHLKQ